jgi:hypothetical protein
LNLVPCPPHQQDHSAGGYRHPRLLCWSERAEPRQVFLSTRPSQQTALSLFYSMLSLTARSRVRAPKSCPAAALGTVERQLTAKRAEQSSFSGRETDLKKPPGAEISNLAASVNKLSRLLKALVTDPLS